MFDEIQLYALAGCSLALALAVVLSLIILCRYWRKRRLTVHKTGADLEKALDTDTETKIAENCLHKQALPSNYGAAKRTLSMDSIVSKLAMKNQSIQSILKSPVSRHISDANKHLYDEEQRHDYESVDEYDYDNFPKYGPTVMEKKNSRTQSVSSACGRRQSSQSFSSSDVAIGTIKPDLYLRKGSLYFQTTDGGASSNVGKVHLRFRYDFRRSDFIVTAIQAELTSDVQDCYLKMFLTPDSCDFTTKGISNKTYRQSKIRRRSAAFAFNEEFKFPVAFSELMEKTLVVQAFDCSPRSRAHHQIGEVCLELNKADPSADIEVLADLTKTRLRDNVYGSLEVALNYLPSVQRLTVSILQAKDLQLEELTDMNICSTVGIYVKCILFQNENKTAIKKKKTSAIQVMVPRYDELQNVDVTWKEQITFHVSESACKSISVQLIICAKQAIRGTPEIILGQLDLGSEESNRECRQHWRQMLKEKIESSVWHKLQIPQVDDSTLPRPQDCD